ncbi:MAG: DUF4349 domain-containing protein [Planctomycetota bacterium]
MMRTFAVVCTLLGAVFVAACQAPVAASEAALVYDEFDQSPRASQGGEARPSGFAKANRGERNPAADRSAQVADPGAGAPAASERLLIYRGDIRVEVARPEDASRAFLDTVKAWGGYLQSQSGATVTVRVPAAKFDDALAAVRGMGRVLDESRQANDVTEEYLDLGIRLDTARKARDRLLEVLQKAEKVEDILKVEAELRRLTEEIERMEGRRKFLSDQVALATLTATFQAIAQAPPPPPRPKQRSRFPWVNRVGAESMMGGF